MAHDEEQRQEPRELTPQEVQARELLTTWRSHHEKQIQQSKAPCILKGSLTRAKRFYEDCYRLAQEAIEELDTEEAKAAARVQLSEFEIIQLEWQDEKDHHIRVLENPALQVNNAQMTQASKDAKYEILHIKAKTRAEDAIAQLVLIQRNLGQSITHRALEIVKTQAASAEDEIETTLWNEYEEMIDLKPESRAALTGEYTAHKKALKEASAGLLAASLALIPASPVTSTPNNSVLGSGGTESNVSSSEGVSRNPHSYQKEKLPIFTGELRTYPRWSRQWKDAQKYFGEDQFFLMLQHSTPDWLDVLSNSSLTEVWEQLDARFASTRVVSEAALKDYVAFIPTKKSKNERLIEISEHVSKTYRDLQSVGKEKEMDQVEHLILKVLNWLDQYHKDELGDLLMKDEKALPAQRVGAFKLTFNYLKTT
ncbi:MAG: hypothetical protein GY737_06220, partial [Desulfobacteraceae bacterium]|nr:hypothetical protein [Desulfobacteraceae bacterium]